MQGIRINAKPGVQRFAVYVPAHSEKRFRRSQGHSSCEEIEIYPRGSFPKGNRRCLETSGASLRSCGQTVVRLRASSLRMRDIAGEEFQFRRRNTYGTWKGQ